MQIAFAGNLIIGLSNANLASLRHLLWPHALCKSFDIVHRVHTTLTCRCYNNQPCHVLKKCSINKLQTAIPMNIPDTVFWGIIPLPTYCRFLSTNSNPLLVVNIACTRQTGMHVCQNPPPCGWPPIASAPPHTSWKATAVCLIPYSNPICLNLNHKRAEKQKIYHNTKQNFEHPLMKPTMTRPQRLTKCLLGWHSGPFCPIPQAHISSCPLVGPPWPPGLVPKNIDG